MTLAHDVDYLARRAVGGHVSAHTHCNSVAPYKEGSDEAGPLYPPDIADAGFRVSGMGMSVDQVTCRVDAMGRHDVTPWDPPQGNFGFPIFDTTKGRLRILYFNTNTDALYTRALECVRGRGWRACADDPANADFISVWLNTTIR